MVFMIRLRVNSFKDARQETTFINTIRLGKNNSLEYPSFSICGEGFSNEFLLNDILVILKERVEYYYENPNEVLARMLNYDEEIDMMMSLKGENLFVQANKIIDLLKTYINQFMNIALNSLYNQDAKIQNNDEFFNLFVMPSFFGSVYEYLIYTKSCLNVSVKYESVEDSGDFLLEGLSDDFEEFLWYDFRVGSFVCKFSELRSIR